jgi:glycosyltransferase involved in cell wall biosynthesis
MQRIGVRVRLVLVGDGPLRAPLEAAHPDVVFCGVQRDERLATHCASADLLLFPSETETFGNVVLEGLASGLVVVAYDYAAAHAHVIDGETGILVPPGDAVAFVARAAAVARDIRRLGDLRARAREAAQPHDWEDVAGRFERLLEQVTRGARVDGPAAPGAATPSRAQAV